MRVLVDTVIWSVTLRRTRRNLSAPEKAVGFVLRELIFSGGAVLVGMVRQELLSGIADTAAFARIRDYLDGFPDETPEVDDYVEAARCNNICRAAGVAATPVDMLLCAMSIRRRIPILTMDADFPRYAAHLSLSLTTVKELQSRLRGG